MKEGIGIVKNFLKHKRGLNRLNRNDDRDEHKYSKVTNVQESDNDG